MTKGFEDRLGNLLAALALGLGERATSAMESATGLSGSAPSALLALRQFLDGCNVTQLAAVVGLTHSGAVRLVAHLENTGHVRRTHLADRRQVNVLLTPRGEHAAAAAAAGRLRAIADVTQALAPDERQQLEPLIATALERLVAIRLRERAHGSAHAWLCRTCDFAACDRDNGRCPAANAATRRSDGQEPPGAR